MSLFSFKRTRQGSSTLTERRNDKTGKTPSTTRSYKSGNYRTTINLGTGKTKKNQTVVRNKHGKAQKIL